MAQLLIHPGHVGDRGLEGTAGPQVQQSDRRQHDEDGNDERAEVVQRRGEPGTDLLEYTADDVEREFYTPKGCESQCTIGCVRRASVFDGWRSQRGA